MSPDDFTALWVTLRLAFISTALLLVLCTPLAWWLARTQRPIKGVIEALVMMPLVLPPTVLGFYLLLLLGPKGWVGGSLQAVGLPHLAFSFTGLVIGSMIFSLPFVMQPLTGAFQAASGRMLEVAATLRASPRDQFLSVVLPLSKRGFLTASVLSFAHTLGEFGVIIMLGGNIVGQTQVASIAIFNHVETMNYAAAHQLSAILVGSAFVLLLAVFALNGTTRVVRLMP